MEVFSIISFLLWIALKNWLIFNLHWQHCFAFEFLPMVLHKNAEYDFEIYFVPHFSIWVLLEFLGGFCFFSAIVEIFAGRRRVIVRCSWVAHILWKHPLSLELLLSNFLSGFLIFVQFMLQFVGWTGTPATKFFWLTSFCFPVISSRNFP